MRIVGGQFRGRRLSAPAGQDTRPTADRTREALFNILKAHGLPETTTTVLDAFAGTGALGLEALSRGAGQAVFFETGRTALTCLEANIASLGVEPQSRIFRRDVTRPPPCHQPAALLFLDPPYHQGLAPPALLALAHHGWLAPQALVVVETAHAETALASALAFEAPLAAAGFILQEQRRYGPASLHFLRYIPPGPPVVVPPGRDASGAEHRPPAD